MMKKYAAVFGYNLYSKQIIHQIESVYEEIKIFVLTEEEEKEALSDGKSVEYFNLKDEWEDISKNYSLDDLTVFCALKDDAENVFLTISLRATFDKLYIISLAKNHESMLKIKSAGASKVMPALEIAAHAVGDMLIKPSVTEVIHELLYEDHGLCVLEIPVVEASPLINTYFYDTDFKNNFDVVLLAIVDRELENVFNFAVEGHNHHIDAGDILVVIGQRDKLESFKHWVGGIS